MKNDKGLEVTLIVWYNYYEKMFFWSGFMIKIFQTGDIHLDSPFSGGDILRSENGRKRLRALFRRMMDFVREKKYDLVLIPGDLYDTGFLSEESAEMIRTELASLPCPVVISPGNHDPYEKGSFYMSSSLPENVHVFSDESLGKFEFEELGAVVYGYAFTSNAHYANPLEGFFADSDKIKILCAHSEVGVPLSGKAPMSYGDMEASGFDYAALAHIHKAPEVYSSSRLTAAYSGFAEGRGFDEIGQGSALSVSIFETGDKKEIKYEKISFSDYSFEILPINVTGIDSDDDIASLIEREIDTLHYGNSNSLRVLLEGFLSLDFSPNLSYIKKRCSSAVDYFEIKDNTMPTFDAVALSKDMTIRGELYRTLEEKLNSGDMKERNLAAMALRIGLASLDGGDLTVFLPKAGEDDENEEAEEAER